VAELHGDAETGEEEARVPDVAREGARELWIDPSWGHGRRFDQTVTHEAQDFGPTKNSNIHPAGNKETHYKTEKREDGNCRTTPKMYTGKVM
jgi:hypothetical protein